ncbi:MAG TPA: iron uptake transporter deferrochelatase/peroxidase subunit [Humibacter sp.]|nr:iron uptake transporter deferrochelatase/peroxidase subunit [Humibacter sp.]
MSLKRRDFLGGMIVTGATAPIGAAIATVASATAQPAVVADAAFPFHGAHQQGIATPIQRNATFVAFDVTASGRAELETLLRTITQRARSLTSGGRPHDVGITAPPADSGVLGPEIVADGLTVTVSVGASLFDERFGLGAVKPARLRTMEAFDDDALDRAVCDGDILVQLCAHHEDTVLHALRDITRCTRGLMQVRWRRDGFHSPARPSGTPRNLFGFKDGTANPAAQTRDGMRRLVWTEAGAGEPAWVAGGSYHVVRVIRMLVEFWDRVSMHEQENMIGRRRDTGAPLTRTNEFDDPRYQDDPTGDVIQLDAHIRLANPRTSESISQQMLRRPYNYDGGVDVNGNLEMGLIFACFQQDLERQFVAVQKRLAGEPMTDYVSPFGGGYYFALPGVRDATDWLGSGMLS